MDGSFRGVRKVQSVARDGIWVARGCWGLARKAVKVGGGGFGLERRAIWECVRGLKGGAWEVFVRVPRLKPLERSSGLRQLTCNKTWSMLDPFRL